MNAAAAAAAKSLQSCPTLWDPIDGSPPGSPVPGILQARALECVAISFSNAWKWKVKVKSLSRVRLLATPWTVAHQAPPSMGFSRQECWSGLPLPSPMWMLLRSEESLFGVMKSQWRCLCSLVCNWGHLLVHLKMAKTANLMSHIYLSYIYIHNKNVSPDTNSFMDKFIKQIMYVYVW